MKQAVFTITSLLLLYSCQTNRIENLEDLNGYWEIEKVIFPDGNSKEYTFSQSIDYFMLENDSTGYRKKMQPQLKTVF